MIVSMSIKASRSIAVAGCLLLSAGAACGTPPQSNGTRQAQPAGEAQPDGPGHWDYTQLSYGGPDNPLLKAVAKWTGPIPSAGHGTRCFAELRDSSGEIVWRSTASDLQAPWDESQSVTGVAFGVEPGISGDPSVDCEPLTTKGWQVIEGSPQVEQHDGGKVWAVGARLEWEGDYITGLNSACTLSVLDGDGNRIASARTSVGSPRSGLASSSRTEDIVEPVREGEPEDLPEASTASVECELVSPTEAETARDS
jgi:hypothetical protein